MSFKPTSILEWVLLGYGGVILLVALLVTPLAIGLGDDSTGSSPLTVVRFGGGFSFDSPSRRGSSRWKARARRRLSRDKLPTSVTSGSNPCKTAIDRMISCTKDAKVRELLSNRKDRFIAECQKRDKDVQKAERCAKRASCKAFERCLGGG